MHARILWHPEIMRWEVIVGRGTARAVVHHDPDYDAACEWAKANGYTYDAHLVTE